VTAADPCLRPRTVQISFFGIGPDVQSSSVSMVSSCRARWRHPCPLSLAGTVRMGSPCAMATRRAAVAASEPQRRASLEQASSRCLAQSRPTHMLMAAGVRA